MLGKQPPPICCSTHLAEAPVRLVRDLSCNRVDATEEDWKEVDDDEYRHLIASEMAAHTMSQSTNAKPPIVQEPIALLDIDQHHNVDQLESTGTFVASHLETPTSVSTTGHGCVLSREYEPLPVVPRAYPVIPQATAEVQDQLVSLMASAALK